MLLSSQVDLTFHPSEGLWPLKAREARVFLKSWSLDLRQLVTFYYQFFHLGHFNFGSISDLKN